jgi:hypothetical protein
MRARHAYIRFLMVTTSCKDTVPLQLCISTQTMFNVAGGAQSTGTLG